MVDEFLINEIKQKNEQINFLQELIKNISRKVYLEDSNYLCVWKDDYNNTLEELKEERAFIIKLAQDNKIDNEELSKLNKKYNYWC